jgi:hypothetical protein
MKFSAIILASLVAWTANSAVIPTVRISTPTLTAVAGLVVRARIVDFHGACNGFRTSKGYSIDSAEKLPGSRQLIYQCRCISSS